MRTNQKKEDGAPSPRRVYNLHPADCTVLIYDWVAEAGSFFR